MVSVNYGQKRDTYYTTVKKQVKVVAFFNCGDEDHACMYLACILYRQH